MTLNTPPFKTKKFTLNTTLILVIITFLITIFALIFHTQIENYIMRQIGNQQMTKSIKNTNPEPDYNAENIEAITSDDIINATNNNQLNELNPEGEIAIPSAGIHLPIYQGVGQWVLFVGAGEQMPRDVVRNGGVGNYILAGHNVMDYGLLFSTLHLINQGDPIYTFDGDNLYTYIADYIDVFPKNESSVLNQVKDKSIITLYTCADGAGYTRYVVQGHLDKTTPKDKITDDQKQPFQIAENTYSSYTAQYLYNE